MRTLSLSHCAQGAVKGKERKRPLTAPSTMAARKRESPAGCAGDACLLCSYPGLRLELTRIMWSARMGVTFADLAAPKAVEAAARVVLEKMMEDPSRDEQIVIHDVINEEILASDIAVSPTQFEAARMAVFLRYGALRAETGLDDEDGDDNEDHDEKGEDGRA